MVRLTYISARTKLHIQTFEKRVPVAYSLNLQTCLKSCVFQDEITGDQDRSCHLGQSNRATIGSGLSSMAALKGARMLENVVGPVFFGREAGLLSGVPYQTYVKL